MSLSSASWILEKDKQREVSTMVEGTFFLEFVSGDAFGNVLSFFFFLGASKMLAVDFAAEMFVDFAAGILPFSLDNFDDTEGKKFSVEIFVFFCVVYDDAVADVLAACGGSVFPCVLPT